MAPHLLSPAKNPRKTSSRGGSKRHQIVSLECQIRELLQKSSMPSTFEIVVSLHPDFWEQSITSRTEIWRETSATLSRMLAEDTLTVAVDQVQVAHWCLGSE
jgi:hypothetical protein